MKPKVLRCASKSLASVFASRPNALANSSLSSTVEGEAKSSRAFKSLLWMVIPSAARSEISASRSALGETATAPPRES
eukprot:8956613-Pyramimonas_sp.AAC.1